jgi:ribonuclease E
MSKRMLIDASHPEETRVVVLDGNKVEEFDFESAFKRPLKGNIYLAKVTRVEPSLQAAFVEYGGNRQGFLAFSEIHPDYYQIPVADRMALLEAQTQRLMAEEDDIESFDTSRRKERASEAAEPAEDANGKRDSEATASEEPSEDDDGQESDAVVDEAIAVLEDAESESETAPERDAAQEVEATKLDDEVAPTQTVAIATRSGPTPVEATAESIVTTEPNEIVTESTGVPEPYQHRERRQNERPRGRRRQYKIQEVIKRRQVILVQVVKEERGTKGASLTTFLSLAGRYCVLMPNTPRGGGISRKITSATDRKRLKTAAQSLDVPEGMGLIIRTAGANRTKAEIKRDYEYLLRLWDNVRELTLRSNAPALVYEEGSLIKRAIRDLYNKDISEIQVDGEAAYRDAKEFMRMLMPSHAKNVKLYKDALPLFQRYRVESQLDAMFSPVVHLRSGGYIVINQTEALVSIDVNSGKATREHSIEDTATKTNLEAADEIARQLRLRDLAGLIVIDFIDMEDSKNDRAVEKRLHNAVKNDRARIQIGKISQFGLLEMSRQRLRAGVLAGSTVTCPHCNGQGVIRSTESAALRLLRALDEEGQHAPAANIRVKAPEEVTIYTLNQKRREVARIEDTYDLSILFEPRPDMFGGNFEIERVSARIPSLKPTAAPVSIEAGFTAGTSEEGEADVTVVEAPAEMPFSGERGEGEVGEGSEEDRNGRRRRRRRRRGGRGRAGQPHGATRPAPVVEAGAAAEFESEPPESAREDQEVEPATRGDAEAASQAQPQGAAQGEGGRRRRRRRPRRGRRREAEPGTPSIAQLPQNDIAAAAGIAPFPPEPLEEAPEPLMPNAPSSPQWTLAQDDQLAARSEEPIPAGQNGEHGRVVSVPPAHVVESAAEAEPDEHEAEAEAPSEPRKGWWQRRFKM